MAFSHGRYTKVLLDQYDLSAYFSEATAKSDVDLVETTTFGAAAKTFMLGFREGMASLSGLWDNAAAGSDALLAAALGAAANKVLTISRESADAVGDRAELLSAIETSYEVASSIDDAAKVSAEFKGDAGGVDYGVILHALEAETADGNETTLDGLAASTNGGVAHLHATAFSGLTDAVITIHHSTDNFVGSDDVLVTFATLTAIGKERVVVAAGTTVRRYLRVVIDVTGTGSITFAVAFARR